MTRATYILPDGSSVPHGRLPALTNTYDIVALRPTSEKALAVAVAQPDIDLISLDLSARYPFYFRHKMFSTALQRGIKFEICYGAATRFAASGSEGCMTASSGAGKGKDGGGLDAMTPAADAMTARRNLIMNATALIRALRGRGVVLSSEARRALACRGPSDVVNLACVWGLGQERGLEGLGKQARAVLVQAEMRRRGWRGVVDVVSGGGDGEKEKQHEEGKDAVKGRGEPQAQATKRKADEITKPDHTAAGDGTKADEPPLSRRKLKQQARQAEKTARQAKANEHAGVAAKTKTGTGTTGNKSQGGKDVPSQRQLKKAAWVASVAAEKGARAAKNAARGDEMDTEEDGQEMIGVEDD